MDCARSENGISFLLQEEHRSYRGDSHSAKFHIYDLLSGRREIDSKNHDNRTATSGTTGWKEPPQTRVHMARVELQVLGARRWFGRYRFQGVDWW